MKDLDGVADIYGWGRGWDYAIFFEMGDIKLGGTIHTTSCGIERDQWKEMGYCK